MILTAEAAKAITNKYKDNKLNYVRIRLLKYIENAANSGQTQICLYSAIYEEGYVNMTITKEDMEYFKNLGYKIKEYEIKTFIPYEVKNGVTYANQNQVIPGYISWGEENE